MSDLLFPWHLINDALAICILIFVVVPLINFLIKARDAETKKSKSACFKKAGIIFIVALLATLIPSDPYLEPATGLFPAIVGVFTIASIVFLIKGLVVKKPKSVGPNPERVS